jgi:hypothetical protein
MPAQDAFIFHVPQHELVLPRSRPVSLACG